MGKYKRSGSYEPDWHLELPVSPIKENHFSFDGRSYSIKPMVPQREAVKLTTVYMDINASWSEQDCNMVYETIRDRHVMVAVSSDELMEITAEGKEDLFHQLRKHRFSLFPFYKITDTTTGLVVSKSDPASPTINDLKGSPFLKNLQTYFTTSSGVKFYNIGNELSPYLKTLKEFRSLRYDQGSIHALKDMLSSNTFDGFVEDDQQVVIENAGIAIVQTTDSLPSNAPDHSMRMFAYNHILKRSGAGLLSGAVIEHELVEEAQKAYVVTPVSSLVVLETQADYDRFDITGSKNSLQNASIKSKGAVPEPHEWALIVVVLLTLLYARFGSSFYKPLRK